MAVSIPHPFSLLYSSEAFAMDARGSRERFSSPPYQPSAPWQRQRQPASYSWPATYSREQDAAATGNNGAVGISHSYPPKVLHTRRRTPQPRRESSYSNTLLWSLPETFDPRGSKTQQEGVEAEPSANNAFVLDSNAPNSSSVSQWSTCNQVPLRATQASPEMRAMMSVFRTNPFSFHGNTQMSDAAEPLNEPGQLIEWQLPGDYQGYCVQVIHDAQGAAQQSSRESSTEVADAHVPLATMSVQLGAELKEQKYNPTAPSYQAGVSASHRQSQSYPHTRVEYGYPLAEVASPRESQAAWGAPHHAEQYATSSIASSPAPNTAGTEHFEMHPEVSVNVQHLRPQVMDIPDPYYTQATRPLYAGYLMPQFDHGHSPYYHS